MKAWRFFEEWWLPIMVSVVMVLCYFTLFNSQNLAQNQLDRENYGKWLDETNIQVKKGEAKLIIVENEDGMRVVVPVPIEKDKKKSTKSIKTTIPETNKPLINLYQKAGKRFGVPWRLLMAIHFIESKYGSTGIIKNLSGARGPMQFMPSTFKAYAVDGDGNGSTDIDNVVDAVYSAANYLSDLYRLHGSWPKAIFGYNRSWAYVKYAQQLAKI